VASATLLVSNLYNGGAAPQPRLRTLLHRLHPYFCGGGFCFAKPLFEPQKAEPMSYQQANPVKLSVSYTGEQMDEGKAEKKFFGLKHIVYGGRFERKSIDEITAILLLPCKPLGKR
jgi:hypothetical protein